jgi:hypothetical protein
MSEEPNYTHVDLEDYPNYQVSNLGRVRSNVYRNQYSTNRTMKILKGCIANHGGSPKHFK